MPKTAADDLTEGENSGSLVHTHHYNDQVSP